VSTEDWQDPVTSRARQREQAEALVRGHGVIVAEFFDVRYQASPEDVIGYLRERQVTLTYDPASGTLDAGTAAQTISLTAS
jgi:hypothetical protein